jgi:hypothetical protein
MPDDVEGPLAKLEEKLHQHLEAKLLEQRTAHEAALAKLQQAHDAAVAEIDKIKGKQTSAQQEKRDTAAAEEATGNPAEKDSELQTMEQAAAETEKGWGQVDSETRYEEEDSEKRD